MPRACIPNARFLARADSPLLPFLAPRAFPESPIPAGRVRHDGGTTQKVQEAAREQHNEDRAVRRDGCLNVQEARWKGPYSTSSREGTTARTSQAPTIPISLRKPQSLLARGPIGLCYADISTIARQQLRRYNTEALDSSVRKVASWEPSQTRRTDRRNRIPRKALRADRTKQLPDLRRKRALLVHRQRLETFLSYETRSNEDLLHEGRYRSLRRRVYNFARGKTSRGVIHNTVQRDNPLKTRRILIRAFAALDRRVYPGIRRKTPRLRILHDQRCATRAARLFAHTASRGAGQAWLNWVRFEQDEREHWWPHLLLYLLDHMPSRALFFLHILSHDSSVARSNPEILADALGYLARLHITGLYSARGINDTFPWSKDSFVPAFFHIFQDRLAPHQKVCSQDLLLNVAKLADVEDLKRVFDLLVETRTYMIPDTLLHYANTFAEASEHRYALLCLKEISRRLEKSVARLDIVNRKRFRWTCALILRKSASQGQNYHETTGIVAEFVNLGIKLDILLYNVIMRNAMEAGDYSTAFQVYNTLEENGLEPDKHTFSILLYGCTTTDDPTKFHDFAEYCARKAKELRDPWLAADYLYYLYVRHYREDTDARQDFTKIQTAYSQFFSTDVLEPFRTTSSQHHVITHNDPFATPFTPMEPPPVAVYIMLQTEIRTALSISNNKLWNLYLLFRRLVRQNHRPILSKLAQDPVIWNAFLYGFCRKQQFANASQLIKDMTDNSPPPNVYSWNIFMQAFFKTSQIKAAERVRDIMRSRGVEPDQFTYGTLLRGYARAQHVGKTGEAMEHLDNEEQLEPGLLQTLARVHNRERLMFALEKARVRREMAETANAESKAEAEKQRWTAPSFPSVDAAGETEEQDEMATMFPAIFSADETDTFTEDAQEHQRRDEGWIWKKLDLDEQRKRKYDSRPPASGQDLKFQSILPKEGNQNAAIAKTKPSVRDRALAQREKRFGKR